MTADDGSLVPRSAVISDEEAAALLERKPHRAGDARPLDLAKLRVTRGKLPLLEVVNQAFAVAFGKSLGALLKRDLQVSLQRIETQKAADYFASVALPACLDVVSIKPLKGSSLISIDAALLSSLVDGYYGGTGRIASRDPERGLTPSELRFGQLLLKQMFADLKQAWAPVAPLEFEVLKHESNPTFVEIAAPGDGVIVNRFLVEIGAGAGAIDFLVPEAALAPLQSRMNGVAESTGADGAHWRAVLSEHVKGIAIEVRCVMADTRMNLRELKALKPGDVIPVDAPGPATLLVGQVPVYSGKFGISRGRNALKLTAPIPGRPGRRGA